jgi:hypothetical protein
MPDFEITLGNAVDLMIDQWQEDRQEPEQIAMDLGD